MSSHPGSANRARFAIMFVVSVWPAASSVTACAESTESGVYGDDASVIAPSEGSDAGVELDGGDGGDGRDVALPDVPCAVGNVCRVQAPLTSGSISAITGRSRDDVWAAGSLGLMMRWDGHGWTKLASSVVPEDLTTVSSLSLSADETWGVAGNTIMRRAIDPDTVSSFELFDFDRSPTSIVVVGGGSVYVGCSVGGIVQQPPTARGILYEIASFELGVTTPVPDPVVEATQQAWPMNIQAMAVAAEKALWTVGDRGAVARYPLQRGDADGWTLGGGVVLPLTLEKDLFAAWADGDHLWAAGEGGVIVHFDGTEWHTQASGTKATLHAIFGLSETDIWAAGDDGVLLHFDGASWSQAPIQGYSGSLRALWGAAPDDVWIGGEGAMFHWGPVP